MLDVRTRFQQSEAFEADVVVGLGQVPKTLPSRWLYDDRGSELFEDITKLDEYYPTRTETAIMQKHSAAMAAFCGPNVTLLEYGAGVRRNTKGAAHAPSAIMPPTHTPAARTASVAATRSTMERRARPFSSAEGSRSEAEKRSSFMWARR